MYNNLYYHFFSRFILFSTTKEASRLVCMYYNSEFSMVGKTWSPSYRCLNYIYPRLTSHCMWFHLSTSRSVRVFGSVRSNIENGQSIASGNPLIKDIYKIKSKCLILLGFLQLIHNILYRNTDFQIWK